MFLMAFNTQFGKTSSLATAWEGVFILSDSLILFPEIKILLMDLMASFVCLLNIPFNLFVNKRC